MKIYGKCACCGRPQNKINPLIMGAGGKTEMFRCLDAGLKKIQTDLDGKNKDSEKKRKKERVEMTLDTFEGEPKKVPGIIQEKYVPENKREKKLAESEAVGGEDEFTTYSPDDAWKDGKNIDPYFSVKKGESETIAKLRVMEGSSRKIRYAECKDWINIGFKPGDADLVMGIKTNKGLTDPEKVLNTANYDNLKAEYDELQQQDEDTDE